MYRSTSCTWIGMTARLARNSRRSTSIVCLCAAERARRSVCGGFRTVGPGHFVGGGLTLPLLAQFLETAVSRHVVDRTGQQGMFDVELQYAPDRPERATNDPSGLSVFTAVREQLGLKLESRKSPVDVLGVDHVEKPTPD